MFFGSLFVQIFRHLSKFSTIEFSYKILVFANLCDKYTFYTEKAPFHSNVYLLSGKTLHISSESPLTGNAKIGITTEYLPDGSEIAYVDITDGKATADYSKFFGHDKDTEDYIIVDVVGENGQHFVRLVKKPAPKSDTPVINNATTKTEVFTIPVSTEAGAVQVTASVTDGKATVGEVSAATVADVISTAKAGENITVDLSVAQQTVTTAILPVTLVTNVASETAKENRTDIGLTVKVTAGSVTLSNTAVAAVAEAAADAETISVVVEKVAATSLSNSQANAVQAKASETNAKVVTAVDSYIMAGSSKVENLGGGSVKLSLSAKAYEGYEASALSVYKIAADGTMTAVKFTVDENGNLVFDTDDLGSFVILAE